MCFIHDHVGHRDAQRPATYATPWYHKRGGKVLIVLLLAAVVYPAYMLWSTHRAHITDFLPLLLFLACPLMHVFMHRQHGGGHRAPEERA